MGFGFRDEHGFELTVGEELLYMRVRRECVPSASEGCVGVSSVVRVDIGKG